MLAKPDEEMQRRHLHRFVDALGQLRVDALADDPRGLRERIDAQLTERIDEAVEMAALHLLVRLREHHGRPAPESDSREDRDEFAALAADLLAYLGEAYEAELSADQRRAFNGARAGGLDARARGLRGQVFLARQLPD